MFIPHWPPLKKEEVVAQVTTEEVKEEEVKTDVKPEEYETKEIETQK